MGTHPEEKEYDFDHIIKSILAIIDDDDEAPNYRYSTVSTIQQNFHLNNNINWNNWKTANNNNRDNINAAVHKILNNLYSNYDFNVQNANFEHALSQTPFGNIIHPKWKKNCNFQKKENSIRDFSIGHWNTPKPFQNQYISCAFCRKSREPSAVYKSHNLYKDGILTCPILLNCVCGLCKNKGHTIGHCPENTSQNNLMKNMFHKRNY